MDKYYFPVTVPTVVLMVAVFILLGNNETPPATDSEHPEPPSAHSTIPYIGHAIGLMRGKFNYYVELSQKIASPIFTLDLPGGTKMYIVSSLPLVQNIQKQPKVLSFKPIQNKFSSQVCGTSPEARQALMESVHDDDGILERSRTGLEEWLTPGKGLDGMNRAMIQNVAASLDGLIPSGKKEVKIKVSAWLREVVTMATTNSVYGPLNPFKDEVVRNSFWQFENDMMTIVIGIFPSILARKGIAARTRVSQAFERYYRANGQEQGSIFARGRVEVATKSGVSFSDMAKYEVGICIALLVNTAPGLFWLLYFLYSDADLLEEIRKEVSAIVETSSDPNSPGSLIHSLDITNVKTHCPLLLSTYQETLRHRGMGTSVREVVHDTILDGKWLLKKECMVQMPSRVLHMDTHIWGPSAAEFNPRRFIHTKGTKRPSGAAFRAFGGGSTLCPGRHFATNEILAVVSMFIMRFDMKPARGEKWGLPTSKNTNVVAVLMEPDEDIDVVVQVRKGVKEGRWAFGLEDSDLIFAVVDEDRSD